MNINKNCYQEIKRERENEREKTNKAVPMDDFNFYFLNVHEGFVI